MDDEYNLKDELLAACALLGRQADGTYIKGEECLDSLKDLQQFLHRDDPVGEIDQPIPVDPRTGKPALSRMRLPWELHRALADWNILQGHILPLLAGHAHDDPEVLYESMVVLYLMTSLPPLPKIELDDEKAKREKKKQIYGSALVPSVEALCLFKEQLAASKDVLTIIMKWLMEPLLNEGDRTEPETVILDLALNMIRNLLQVDAPQDERGERFPIPASLKARLRSAQDALILKFAEENVMEMLLVLAQSVEEDENRNWNLLLMDIFTLLFVKEEASEVIASADVMSGAWKTSERRKELLAAVPKPQSVQQRRAKCAIRNNRCSGTFRMQALNGISYLGATPSAQPSANAHKKKKAFRKKDLVEAVEERSAVGRCDVLVELDKYAQLFVQVGFNSLFTTVTYDIAMENAAMELADHANFTALSSWFMRYHRLKEKSRIAALPKRPKPDADKANKGAAAAEAAAAEGGAAAEAAAAPPAHGAPSAGRQGSEQTAATLAMTAEKLVAMMRKDAGAEEGEDAAGAPEAEAEAGAGAGADAAAGGSASARAASVDEAAGDGRVAHAAWSAWAGLPSVVSWNIKSAAPPMPATSGAGAGLAHGSLPAHHALVPGAPAPEHAGDGRDRDGEDHVQDTQQGEQVEARTPDEAPPDEPLDPYEFNAGLITAMIDMSILRDIALTVHTTCKPMMGSKDGKGPQWEKLPPLVAMMRELVAIIHILYYSRSKTNKDVAESLLRQLIYDELDFGNTLSELIKEFRPFRNSRQYFADVVDVTHHVLRLVRDFSDANPNLQTLRKKRRTRRSKKKVEGKEGDGEWLGGGSDMEDFEEETYEDTAFSLEKFQKMFAKSDVVAHYIWLLDRFKVNSQQTNHQVLKMLDMVARKCEHLPLLFQASVFRVFNRILSASSVEGKKEFKETVDFVRWVVREFFKLALQAPCLFVEVLSWTKTQGDAGLIMRVYKPEEREHKGKKRGPKNEDEYILEQQERSEGKWSEDDDLALKELFEQFSAKANAPQIIATHFDGKSATQIARRLNTLGMATSGGGDWSEGEYDEEAADDDDSEMSLYVCARRLRNKAPLALDWIIDAYGLACETRDKTLHATNEPGQDLPEEFFEVQDFAIVPVVEAEWEHLINPATMRLLGALGCLGPRPLEGHAFWRITADALRDDARTAAVLDELLSAQSAEIEEEPAEMAPDDSDDETSRPPFQVNSPARLGQPPAGTSSSQAIGRSGSPPTRQKRRIQLQESDSEEEASAPVHEEAPASASLPQDAGEQAAPRRLKRALLADSDEEDAEGLADGGGEDREGPPKTVSAAVPSKRARLAARDSDSD